MTIYILVSMVLGSAEIPPGRAFPSRAACETHLTDEGPLDRRPEATSFCAPAPAIRTVAITPDLRP